MNKFNYKRRKASKVTIGNLPLGGSYPIRVQSMTNTNTNDTEESAEQVIKIANAGGEYVRLTAQGAREASNLENIQKILREKGFDTPLIADIHFNPKAAEVAAKIVQKVRINPGNFVDKIKTFEQFDYSKEEYNKELDKIKEKLIPLLDICKENKCALRLGINHGSLSDRIMSRYGDTPKGMVESCMEFLRICIDNDFHEIVISMKTSNTIVMNESVKLLINEMDKESLKFPIHLGVTEAGDGEDGRIKSAAGIGALLSMGIGDTIRVSLSEDPEFEIPVAQKIVSYIAERENHKLIEGEEVKEYSAFDGRRKTYAVKNIGDTNMPIVISDYVGLNKYEIKKLTDSKNQFRPDYVFVSEKEKNFIKEGVKKIIKIEEWIPNEDIFPLGDLSTLDQLISSQSAIKFLKLDYEQLYPEVIAVLKQYKDIVIIVHTNHQNGVGEQLAFMHKLMKNNIEAPVIIQRSYEESNLENLQIKASIDLGTLLIEGFGNGISLINKGDINLEEIIRTSFGILQASRLRTTKTEFISCPGCGRTLFDLQSTVAKIKEATQHLTHLKIGIMGCIVNGPGEMADADYGYVGAERGKVSLYKRKECIKKNIPAENAVDELINLIKENGDWIEPLKNK